MTLLSSRVGVYLEKPSDFPPEIQDRDLLHLLYLLFWILDEYTLHSASLSLPFGLSITSIPDAPSPTSSSVLAVGADHVI